MSKFENFNISNLNMNPKTQQLKQNWQQKGNRLLAITVDFKIRLGLILDLLRIINSRKISHGLNPLS